MNQLAQNKTRRNKIGITVGVGTLLLASFAGAYVYRTLFARPGEAALNYVPADALAVISIDLSPSPTQALAFKQIDNALSRNGLERYTENSILDMIQKSPLNAELAPLVKRGAAGCLDSKPGRSDKEMTGLLFISVSDGGKALEIIQKHAQPKFYKGLKYYVANNQPFGIYVLDDLLVMSDDPAELLKVKEIKDGTRKAITSVPEFLAAREDVASDANVMAFASQALWNIAFKDIAKTSPNWMALGIAVRDGGIGLSMAGKTDPANFPELKTYASIPPVRIDLFQVLPEGSYGMFATSDLGTALRMGESSVSNNKDARKGIQDMEDSMEKSIGLSVQNDLIPALRGDVVAAVYPSRKGEVVGVDVLAVIDDLNGGDPSSAVQKFQAFMDKQMSKEGNEQKLFTSKSIDGGMEYRINDKMEADMQKGLGDGIDSSQFNKPSLVGNKTVVYAFIGKTVIASTSQELLDRAVNTYRSKTNGLEGDTKFAPYEKSVLDGSQSVIAFSLSRIAEGVKNTIHPTKMNQDDAKLLNSVLDAFLPLKDPFMIKAKATPDGIGSGGVFIPMDYDKMIDLIGSQMKKK